MLIELFCNRSLQHHEIISPGEGTASTTQLEPSGFYIFFPLPSSQSIYRILHFTVTITSASLFLATKCNLTNVLPMYIHAVPCTHVYPRTRKGCVLCVHVQTSLHLANLSFFFTLTIFIYILYVLL